ncbi:MAG: hypothetical protein KDD10_14170 [Phaeodactylibacter sp.]|nr:hypothetical protein [Phaeodactylibacter sp.]MCB9296402.1 hypothetical protein [Lewinellaceae bacterium]
MPVEIRELVIKANITESSDASPSAPSGLNQQELEARLKQYKQQIIAECMDQVFDLIKEKNQR